MVLLMLFALVAGAGTALSPCVLPVLPIALSAGATGGRRRPLGIVIGLTASFAFAAVALVYVIDALGLPDGLTRTLAIATLIGFGVALLVPPLAARLEGRLSRLLARAGAGGPAGAGGDGLRSGLLLGASLGFVYAPCAGPVLGGVIVASASQTFTAGRLAVVLAYAVGSGAVLYALMRGGRRLAAPLSRRSGALQVAMGAVMVVVALAMLGDYDVRFQSAIAKDLPGFLVNPAEPIQQTDAVERALAKVKGGAHGIAGRAERRSRTVRAASRLPVLGRAPDFLGTQQWFNTPGDAPLTLRGLRGRVVLIDFWTYSCINCLRTLPYLRAWDARYRNAGLTIVGVHTPEFPFEKDAGNVADAVEREGIGYPVVQDNEMATWDAYGNQYWPAEYLLDTRGRVRFAHFGEGAYGEKEHAIRELLAAAGRRVGGQMSGARGVSAAVGVTTPESYLGAARDARFANGPIFPGARDFGRAPAPREDGLAYGGRWRIGEEAATAGAGATLALRFGARRVYLVLGSPGRARHVRVLLDGRPIPDALAGADVQRGSVTVGRHRLYALVDLPRVGRHVLRLEPEQGVAGYAFTFG